MRKIVVDNFYELELLEGLLQENQQEVEILLAVFCTGAYTYSMSSNYNGLTRAAMVLVIEWET